MPLLLKKDLRKAVDNIANWGDTDLFPLPIENHVFHDVPEKVTDLLADLASNFDEEVTRFPVDSYSTLAPVGYTGFRWATQIEPLWNAYLLGAVISLAPQIESARLSEDLGKVFSYRYRPDSTDHSLFAQDSWNRFQKQRGYMLRATSMLYQSTSATSTHAYIITGWRTPFAW